MICWFHIGKDKGNILVHKGYKVVGYLKEIQSVYFELEIFGTELRMANFSGNMQAYFI
jgi:hypothetical protein